MKEKNHFIHYLKRKVVVKFPKDIKDPWFGGLTDYATAIHAPHYHITSAKIGPAAEVRAGDIIWIMSLVKTPWGKLAIALDGKIEVEKVEKRKEGGFVYLASKNSRWYPLMDVSETLKSLKTRRSSQEIYSLIKNNSVYIGQALQRIRKLENPEVLVAWEKKIIENELYFVSYRIADGTKKAYHKVDSLMKEGKAVFWDRWSLPRRMAERREVVEDKSLDLEIRNNIKKAKAVYCINSLKYGEEGSYSLKEKELAISLKKLI